LLECWSNEESNFKGTISRTPVPSLWRGSPNLARATEKGERSNVAQKYSEAPKMLNQASMLRHFVIPTASNGSPSKALLRRDFARGESLEQKRQGASGERHFAQGAEVSRNARIQARLFSFHSRLPSVPAAPSAGSPLRGPLERI